jgi:lysophospholipase L1-like esterase
LFNLKINELPPQGMVNPTELAKFEASLAKLSQATGRTQPGILFLYPTEVQLQAARQGREWLPERPELQRISREFGIKLVDISSYPTWTAAQYREGTHPTVEGNRILADILSTAIKDSFQQEPPH